MKCKILVFFHVFLWATTLMGQENLCKHKSFFKIQTKEYAEWLDSTNIDDIIHFSKVSVKKEKVTLFLVSNLAKNQAFKATWNKINEVKFPAYSNSLEKHLFDTYIFLLDLEPSQAEIIVLDKQKKKEILKIYYRNNNLEVDDLLPDTMSGGTITIPLDEIRIIKTNSSNTSDDIDIVRVRKKIGTFLQDYYSDKGSTFYTARVDTSRTYSSRIIYDVTCLKNEITKSGFYEYIRIEVSLFYVNKELKVAYNVRGKIASGILCPGSGKKFYKSMETKYGDELENYSIHIRELITDLIKTKGASNE